MLKKSELISFSQDVFIGVPYSFGTIASASSMICCSVKDTLSPHKLEITAVMLHLLMVVLKTRCLPFSLTFMKSPHE
jgi:hypothetical protein